MISRIDCPNHNAILGLLNNTRLLTFRIYSDNLLIKIKTIKAANSIRITFFLCEFIFLFFNFPTNPPCNPPIFPILGYSYFHNFTKAFS